MAEKIVIPGLRGVVASETRLSSVDGLAGELIIAGYPLEELAPNASFEQTVYLLWNDRLPNEQELTQFNAELVERRIIPQATLTLLRSAAEKQVPVMDVLRMGASTLSLEVSDDDMSGAAMTLIASFPTIIASYWRMREGKDPIAPNPELGHASNYLYMLTGNIPSDEQSRALETYLNTVVDHSLNASTFTARVIIATESDMISAIVGALGALKGRLHGGAPGPALDMVFEIGTKDNAEPYIDNLLKQGERLMGFGHRVYKVRDPRADVLKGAAERFFEGGDGAELYDLVKHVEQVALRLLEQYKPGRNLQTNVEFYTALVLHGIGLGTDMFTPTFAIGRVAGWTAHAFEQHAEGNLIRPDSLYIGDKDRRW